MSRALQTWLPFTLVVALLALPPLGEARIRPEEQRIGKIEIGMTEQAAREKLGPPDKIKRVLPYVRRFVYRERKLRLDLNTNSEDVVRISTRNPRQQTPAGSGVESTRRQLERREDDRLHCEEDRVEGDCWIQPRGQHSGYYTYFLIDDGRVVEVLIQHAGAPL